MNGSLKDLAIKLGTQGPHKTLPTPRKIQLLFNGVYIVRSVGAVFVWEHPFFPQLYIPASDFLAAARPPELSISEGETYSHGSSSTPIGKQWILGVGARSITQTIAFSPALSGPGAPLAGLVKIDFASVDKWFEEDTPIYAHPKDPFKRIDILASTRRLRVRVDGRLVAETQASMHLYETGLPCRFYIPLTSIDAAVLRPSKTVTRCPYKGEAEYYSVEVDGKVHEDIVWYYDRPLMESAKVEGLCCFYGEKDGVEIELDGEVVEKPVTPMSKAKAGQMPSFE